MTELKRLARRSNQPLPSESAMYSRMRTGNYNGAKAFHRRAVWRKLHGYRTARSTSTQLAQSVAFNGLTTLHRMDLKGDYSDYIPSHLVSISQRSSSALDACHATNEDPCVPEDFKSRFRVDTFRPADGGLFMGSGGDRVPLVGSLKGDFVRAVRVSASYGSYESAQPSTTVPDNSALERVLSALASGTYANSKAPTVLAFALSKLYPAHGALAPLLSDSDMGIVRALCAAEKYGYRVSLARMDLSHFGNPETRHLERDYYPPIFADPQPMCGVRAIQASLSVIRDFAGNAVFATDADMLVPEACVMNSDDFWSGIPDEHQEHHDTIEGLPAYYDIEHVFSRSTVVLWKDVDAGEVLLKYKGAEELVCALQMIDMLDPDRFDTLNPDLVEPYIDEGLLVLEAPDHFWRNLRGRCLGKRALGSMLFRIATRTGDACAVQRVLEAVSSSCGGT